MRRYTRISLVYFGTALLLLATAIATAQHCAEFFPRFAAQSVVAASEPEPLPGSVQDVEFDRYGGIRAVSSTKPTTGWFRLERFGNRWLFVDPDNHPFFLTGVFEVGPNQDIDDLGSSMYARSSAKYGDAGPAYAVAAIRRLQSWGFNTAVQSSRYIWPVTQDRGFGGDGFIPVKVPFMVKFMTSLYAMNNTARYLPEPVKDFQYAINATIDSAWRPSQGEADYFDPKLYQYLASMLARDSTNAHIDSAPRDRRKYLLAVSIDESDQTFSFTVGNELSTIPSGYNHAHGAWRVAICSPIQTANYDRRAVYSDIKVYAKYALRDYLKSLPKYQTNGMPDIAKLNAAWGSTYSTWDSSGTVISDEPLALSPAPDGKNRGPFTFRVRFPRISQFSLALKQNNALIAGDIGEANAKWHPNPWGTGVTSARLDYSSGTGTIAFAVPPAANSRFTVSYIQNGWGLGNGLLDEDGRHKRWMGSDAVHLSNASRGARADLSGFLYQMAKHYMLNGRNEVWKHWTWKPLYTGTDMMGGWNVPGPAEALRAAGEVVDFIVLDGSPTMSQVKWDFIRKNYGDKPVVVTSFTTANSDSAYWRYTANGSHPSQQQRGEAYRRALLANFSMNTSGVHPVAGMIWFQWSDKWGEKANWGLVSGSDNAYDGKEAVRGRARPGVRSIPCQPPLEKYLCGGEERDYGDVITPVKNIHKEIMYRILLGQ